MLEALRAHGLSGVRIFQASSSEMFGNAAISPQNEETPLHPVSPYGCAKSFAHMIAQMYRQAYHMHICCGISFNHESERRGEEFVTRKISKGVADIVSGKKGKLLLGDLRPKRDWLHARDVVEAARLILQWHTPDDYVIASEETHSVEEFVALAFNRANLKWKHYVEQDPALMRPIELHELRGNARKLRERLGWRAYMDFPTLVSRMVDNDIQLTHTVAGDPSRA